LRGDNLSLMYKGWCIIVSDQDVAALRRPTNAEGGGEGPRHRLGPFLCWAVVFADIGTSVYYTPGILFGQVGVHAALFVAMTTVVFLLLTLKYAEVCVRYPEGGGVVTVGARALHPIVGAIGGMFILVDYFLTAALSALSGIIYLSVVLPALTPVVLPVTVGALIVLGVLNWVGISESAKVSALFAVLACLGQFAVLLAVLVHVGPGHLLTKIPRALSGPRLGGVGVLTGYAGAFLAFSGLESISQLSPVMATPRRRVARVALGLVVATVGLTSPLLTLWSTTVLPITTHTDPNQFISLLGAFAGGRALGATVAVSAALLLVFASNTAIIGSYHVFLALARMRFFPPAIAHRNRLRDTPHWAILVATAIPVLVLVLAQGSVSLLGDLYAFGLLGAFSLTSLSLDIVRWRERRQARRGVVRTGAGEEERDVPLASPLLFALGVLTTVLVVLAWSTNLVAKPLATAFGGGVSAVGLAIALTTYGVQRRRGRALVFPTRVRGALPDALLVVLPLAGGPLDAVLRATRATAEGRTVVFLYRGAQEPRPRRPGLFEVVDPYLDDLGAQEAFGRAERMGRRLGGERRYVYLPWSEGPEAVTRVWQTVQPREVLVAAQDSDAVHGIAPDRVTRSRSEVGGAPVLHYLKHWPDARTAAMI